MVRPRMAMRMAPSFLSPPLHFPSLMATPSLCPQMARNPAGSLSALGLFMRAVLPQVVGPSYAGALLDPLGAKVDVPDAATVAVMPAAASQARRGMPARLPHGRCTAYTW